MELLRTTGGMSWFRGHSQMPLSWPKPLRWVVRFQGLLLALVFWAAALGPFRPCPAVQTPRNSLLHPYSPFRHNCISETPHPSLLQNSYLRSHHPIPPPNPHQPVPSGSQISLVLALLWVSVSPICEMKEFTIFFFPIHPILKMDKNI